jgi:hypothetical protein
MSVELDLSSYSFDQFLLDHEPQLRHFKVPQTLWPRIHEKLINEIFDAGSAFMFAQEEDSDGKLQLGVYTAEGVDLEAESEVFLIDHAWTFRNKKQAKVLVHFGANLFCIPGIEYMTNNFE